MPRLPDLPEAYLDWNATSPPCEEALEAQARAFRDGWGNPSSVHASGRRARRVVEDVREALADALGLHPRDIAFTSGGTEANNLCLWDAAALVTSRLEHPSVVRVAERLERNGKIVRWVAVEESGELQLEAVRKELCGLPRGSWVSVMAVNHETGVLQPVRSIADLAHASGHWLHVDAVQALGKLERQHWSGADRVCVAAHKLRGPKGVGAVGWAPGAAPEALLLGGAQERGLRPGTLDPAAIAGFGAALERALRLLPERARLADLRDRLEERLGARIAVNGTGQRASHVSNFSCEGWRGDELVAALDLQGIRVSSGSACSAGTAEPSPVIEAMAGRARATSALRVSLGETTTHEDTDRLGDALLHLLGASAQSSAGLPLGG
jgi:cysteine desulfurase